MTWQTIVVLVESAIFVPLYILVLFAILRGRKDASSIFQSHYYTLVISQGLVDFFAIFFVISIIFPRLFNIGNELYCSTFADQIAAIYANSGAFCFIIRLFGISLISLQRYLTICWPKSTATSKLKHCKPVTLILSHWLVSMLIFAPTFSLKDTHFVDCVTLFLITSDENNIAFGILIIFSFAVLTPINVLMYSRILLVIFSKNNAGSASKAKYQEHRLCFHVFLLTFMSALIFLYQCGEASFANSDPNDAIIFVRRFHPILSGNFSFINPLILILLNKEIQTSVKWIVLIDKPQKTVSDTNQRVARVTPFVL